jgi:lysophospholipase L1-like esterase
MQKTINYLRQGLQQNQALARLSATSNSLTVNPQVPGSSPGRGAKIQTLRPQQCGLFVVFIRHILDMSKMARQSIKKLAAFFCLAILVGCGRGPTCIPNPGGEYAQTVLPQADAAAFRAKYQSGAAIGIAIVGDSTTLGSDTMGFQTYLRLKNPNSVVYNFGHGGWRVGTHIRANTIPGIAAMPGKPDAVFIALGINDVQYGLEEGASWDLLVQQTRAGGMLPVLVKENNIACPPVDGHEWVPQPMWQLFRWSIDQAAIRTSVEVIDLGSNDGYINPSWMHDYLHPNVAGYAAILAKYEAWMNTP